MASRYKTDKRYQQRHDKVPWTQYTPTLSNGAGGAVTGGSPNYVRYQRVGTTVHVQFDIVIAAVGATTGHLHFNLPFAAPWLTMGAAREVAINGSIASVQVSGPLCAIIFYNGTLTLANGYRWAGGLTYETNEP